MTYSNTYSSPSSPTNFNPFSGMGMRKGGRPSLFPGSGDGSTLNLDFTTGVLDSRLTFSRASTATFVNSSGYVEWAGSNLFIRSSQLNVAWAITGVTTPTTSSNAPNGDSAWRLEETNVAGVHQLSQSVINLSQYVPYTLSLLVKKDQRSWIVLQITGSTYVYFNSDTGTFGTTSGTLIGYDKQDIGGGWWRVWVSANMTSTTAASVVYLASADGTVSYTGTTGFGVLISSPQLNPGSTAQTYYPTTTAAYYAPRFDYSPTTIGEPRGLLIEASAINYAKFSDAPGTTGTGGWSTGGTATITFGGGATSPDGITASTRIQFPPIAGATISRIFQATTYPVTSYPYTMSVWMKSNTAGNHTINILGSVNTNNVVTPTWQRFVVTVTASASLYGYFYISNESSTLTTDISIWGAQLEAGSGASSYIPTGASQVTRNRDTAVMSDISALNYTNAAGTLFVDFTNNTENANYAGSIAFNNGANYAQRFRLGVGSLLVSYFQTNGITGLGSNLFGARTSFARAKAASSYSFDGTTTTTLMSMNGAAASVTPSSSAAASVSIPTNLSLNFDNSSGALDYVSMTIRSIKYFPTAKSLVDMNGLTT